MSKPRITICIAGLALILSVASFADVDGDTREDETCDRVQVMLQAGNSPQVVISAVVDSGMRLPEATVFAMVCGGERNRVAIASAGVGLAGSLAEALSVVTAVLAAAGETGPVADAARGALIDYERTARQPPVYKGDYSPTGGGGVSPST